METKHTAGPWQYGFPTMNGTPIREVDCQVMSRGCLIANVSHGPIYPAEPFASEIREANARLMAGAPDLLEALTKLCEAIDSCVDLTPEVLRNARAAIAKATKG